MPEATDGSRFVPVPVQLHFWLVIGLTLLFSACNREPQSPAASNIPSPLSSSVTSTNSTGRITLDLPAKIAQIEARERAIDETVWAKEILAEEAGRVIEDLWDSINAATNKLSVIASFPFGYVQLGNWNRSQSLPHDIDLVSSDSLGPILTSDQWPKWVSQFAREGWELVTLDFRHAQIDFKNTGQPVQSRFRFAARLTNSLSPQRATIEGDLLVAWGEKPPAGPPAIRAIDLSQLQLKTRSGEPPFQLLLSEPMSPLRNSRSIDPLIVYDLDGDGYAEIVLAAVNRLYRRTPTGAFKAEDLCRYPPGVVYSALIADFDGDGVADLLCQKYEGLLLYKGSPGGHFEQPGRLVWAATRDVRYPVGLTCGDIDHDGDLDVFLTQYKLPFDGGQMPTPYYDANDGFPAYLLLNDGHGSYTNATVAAGLDAKSTRRSYGASFVDLDGDGHLDLLVVSDFAGIDLYRNDGHGHFTDVTRQWLPESHLFGMAHTVADFNVDGRLDFFVSGMPSATADRLEHLGLWRPDSGEDHSMRSRMTHGNRLYLGKAEGGFTEKSSTAGVDRSGWSWGCSAADFDNDGFPDLYVGSGMETRHSVREYEGEFWLHDAYVATSAENPVVSQYLQGKLARVRGKDGSYGGHECNRLFLSQGSERFQEVGHMFGVALERDCRNVMTGDLDSDGRVDLIVSGYEPWPNQNQRIWVFKNALTDTGNWIGFRFREEGAGISPVGVRVTLHFGNRVAVQQIVAGDSYRSQHANVAHFGLGQASQVDEVEIRWTNGRLLKLPLPAINRYHDIRALKSN
jgi:hypothetical protein